MRGRSIHISIAAVLFAASAAASLATGDETLSDRDLPKLIQPKVAPQEQPPAGLIGQLPPDGTWARFEGESTLSGQPKNIIVTIASVGKTKVQGGPCRWIELSLEEQGPVLTYKLLIPEQYLGRGARPLDHLVTVWRRQGEQEPVNVAGMDPLHIFGLMATILMRPRQEIRQLDTQVLDSKHGRLRCAVWTGRKTITFNLFNIEVGYQQWTNDDAPFAVVKVEIQYTIKKDGRFVAVANLSLVLAEVGTDARPHLTIPDRALKRPFAPAPGWQWAVPPHRANWGLKATLGLVIQIGKNDQDFCFTLAHPSSERYRPVAFDANQVRYEFSLGNSGASGDIGLAVFNLLPSVLPPDRVWYIGLEEFSLEDNKEPSALVGKPLPNLHDFGIDVEREALDSNALMICFWDAEQRPSRNMVRELAKRVEQFKEKGISVICVQTSNLEQQKLHEWVKENAIPFLLGMIEGDAEQVRLNWGVKSLPWLILTDSERVVRAEGFAVADLEEKLKTDQEKIKK